MICEKMNFKGCFSLTKTATGILFKFSHPEDYQAVFKKGKKVSSCFQRSLEDVWCSLQGFHKVTGARFYKKVSKHHRISNFWDKLRVHKNFPQIQIRIDHDQVAIPCRPQKTFTLYVYDVPDDLPEEDIRHALYKFNSVVEVVRLVVFYQKQPTVQEPTPTGEFDESCATWS